MNYEFVFEECLAFKTVVLANGSFPTHPFVQCLLNQAQHLIVCDGAAEQLLKYGLLPEAIVGDGDSLPPMVQDQYASLFYRDTDIEINDLCKAMKFCKAKGYHDVLIMGATGYREDHSIGNIAHLANFALDFKVKMITDYGVFEWIQQSQSFRTQIGQQISVFSFDNHQTINSKGLKYPISERHFTALWEGSLNEAVSSEITLTCNGAGLLLYRSYDIKF